MSIVIDVFIEEWNIDLAWEIISQSKITSYENFIEKIRINYPLQFNISIELMMNK